MDGSGKSRCRDEKVKVRFMGEWMNKVQPNGLYTLANYFYLLKLFSLDIYLQLLSGSGS